MIYFNGNTYKTLDQKFYLGNKQIGKVYYGNTLVYPEFTKKVITEEGSIEEEDIPAINGNVYDTGIRATGSTGIELIFNTTFDNSESYKAFFGTHDNSSSYTQNKNKYSSNTCFHFIINKNYSIRLRYYNGNGSDIELKASLSEDEKAANLFWVSFRNKEFKFGTGGEIGKNVKTSTTYTEQTFTGANLWINGHNQGYATPNVPIRSWIGGNFGLQIPNTKFHYIKVFNSDTDYYIKLSQVI